MKRLNILFFGLMLLLPLSAQIRGNNIVVSVYPDHKDWNYKTGEKATFTIEVRKSATLLSNVTVDIEAGPVMYPDNRKTVTLKDGATKWTGTMNKPGSTASRLRPTSQARTTRASARQASPPRSSLHTAMSLKTSTTSGRKHSTKHARTTLTLRAGYFPSAAQRMPTSMR